MSAVPVNIADLIQEFLKYLIINNVDRLSIALLELPALTNFSVTQAKISTIDLQHPGTPNLEILHCGLNSLESLDLSGLTKLTQLYCYNNLLTRLDLSHVSNLTYLFCYDNSLTELDLSCLPHLTELECSENSPAELDLSCVPNLAYLFCSENSLAELVPRCACQTLPGCIAAATRSRSLTYRAFQT